MYYVIDRFEENFAVCEHNGKYLTIERVLIPDNAKENDFLFKNEDGVFQIDYEQTLIHKEIAISRYHAVFKKDTQQD